MQIYDGNLLHILKPMTRKTRGKGALKAGGEFVFPPRAKSREIDADYRVKSCYLDLQPTTFSDRFFEEIASPMIGVRKREKREARHKAERRIRRRSEANE